MGCCRPRLLTLGGSLLLTGGRCTPTREADNHLWLNRKGDGELWHRFSLSYFHNLLGGSAIPKYSEEVNCTKDGVRLPKCDDKQTLGYTSLLRLSNSSGLVVYSLNSRKCPCAYSMRISLRGGGEPAPSIAKLSATTTAVTTPKPEMPCGTKPCGPSNQVCRESTASTGHYLPPNTRYTFHLTDASCGIGDPNGPFVSSCSLVLSCTTQIEQNRLNLLHVFAVQLTPHFCCSTIQSTGCIICSTRTR
eukprot:COSAG05_NODE_1223_length_5468_cov_31.139877_2_plen_247_part_00